jgi:predicted acetyltransferase
MDLQITPASVEEREALITLVQLYVYDLSELLGFDVGDDGRFGTPALEPYWSDPRRHPFLIRVDGKLAGFALVHRQSRLTGDESIIDMAEFFVMRRFRRHGVGGRAAAWLFDRFRGPWEVRQKADNLPATAFWRRAIRRYTDGKFTEEHLDDPRWRGPVHRLNSTRG